MKLDAGIIGGTGVGDRLLKLPGEFVHLPTQYGMVRGKVIEVAAKKVLVLSRHSGAKVPPHRVNYLALSQCLKNAQVMVCFSTAAVGCLHADWAIGSLCIPHDYLDLSSRNVTHYNKKIEHIEFSEPLNSAARDALIAAGRKLGIPARESGIYINMNGPRFETPEEIQYQIRLGGDIVGMTMATEAIAMREVGVPYACVSIITNTGCGLTDHVHSHQEVVQVMHDSGDLAVNMIKQAIEAYP